MPLETLRPTSVTNPDDSLPTPTYGAFTTVDLVNGDFSNTESGLAKASVSVAFGETVTASSNTLKLSLSFTGANSVSLYVSYNGAAYQLLQTYADSALANYTYTLQSNISPSSIRIGIESITDIGGGVTTIDDFRLESTVRPVIQLQSVNTLALELMAEYGDRNASAKKLSIVEKWINRVYQKIISYYGWPFAKENEEFPTVANTSAYVSAAASMQFSSMRHSTGEPIRYRSRDQLVRDQVDFSVTGKPRFFYHEGMDDGSLKVVLVPTPDAVYTITGYTKPLPLQLVSSDDVPLPTNLIPILLDGTRYYYSQSDGHPDDAQAHLANFKSELRDLAHLYRIEPADDSHMQEVDVVDIDVRDGRFGDNFPSGIF